MGKIIVIDVNPANIVLLSQLLKKQKIIQVSNIHNIKNAINKYPLSKIICDLNTIKMRPLTDDIKCFLSKFTILYVLENQEELYKNSFIKNYIIKPYKLKDIQEKIGITT